MNARLYAVLATLAALGLALGLWREQISSRDLSAQVTRLSRRNAELRYELKQASHQATDVGQRAVELDSELGSAKARTTATETKNIRLAHELTEREQREVALMAELAAARQSATTAGDAVSRQRIETLETQLIQLLTRALAEPVASQQPEPAPVSAPYQVVRVGPADAFVVLNYGAADGAHPQAIIRLQRGTSELAQVQISDVRPRFSLAQVLPDTLKGQLQTGDLVVFTP
jgi:hypothetical protein